MRHDETMNADNDAHSARHLGRRGVVIGLSLAGGALVAVGIAIAITVWIAGEPASDHTQTPTESRTPSVTPNPAPTTSLAPATVLDGDCSRLLSDPSAVGLPGPLVMTDRKSAFSMSSDTESSIALLGGLVCSDTTTDGERLTVSVFPGSTVSTALRNRWSAGSCSISRLCEAGVAVGDFWIAVTKYAPNAQSGNFESYETEVSQLSRAIAEQAGSVLASTYSRPVASESDWWKMGACPDLTPLVERAVGGSLVPEFPGDAVPEGIAWEVTVEAGLQDWCPWSGLVSDRPVIVEAFVMPGVGAPTADNLVEGWELAVPGADQAWTRPDFNGHLIVVAVVGSNRLLVRTHTSDEGAASALVASLIAQMEAPQP